MNRGPNGAVWSGEENVHICREMNSTLVFTAGIFDIPVTMGGQYHNYVAMNITHK
jgi:hypothetical protein